MRAANLDYPPSDDLYSYIIIELCGTCIIANHIQPNPI
jgi:hypothetical protein